VTPELTSRVEAALGTTVVRARALGGGNIAETFHLETASGEARVVKVMPPAPQPTDLPPGTLIDEAEMLAVLRRSGAVPVPDVLHAGTDLLIMTYVSGEPGTPNRDAERDLADKIAALHAVTAPEFGYERPTPVGPLMRPNDQTKDWRAFLRDHRLMFLGELAAERGGLPDGCLDRLTRLCARLSDWIPNDRAPSLIHGDLWIGNILFRADRVAALIDPAVYFADAEIELAFMTLFGGVGESFFARYGEHRPIDPLFFDERRAIYQVEPLLAHAWFFGGDYGARVDQILIRYIG
jgi:fructosamine-3-kinase